MKRAIVEWLRRSPFLGGMLMGTVIVIGAFAAIWVLAWVLHFAGEFIHWLPWPKDSM